MNTAIKPKIPMLFLIAISLSWGFYFSGQSWLNDYGYANFEWLNLIDALIMLPVVCFFCINNKKQALLKAIVVVCLAILIGSYIVPEQNKIIWHYLENGRYLLLAVVLLLEVIAISTVYLAIQSALGQQRDPDLAIEKPIKRLLGEGAIARVLNFETRLWTYALFSKRVKPENFCGDKHFSYHLKDGAQSNLQGFVILIAFELPLMHLLLHVIWSPLAANIVTLLTVFALVFFYAEYRAVSRRPISLLGDTLMVRFGLYQPFIIPLANIARISQSHDFIKRAKDLKRYNYSGVPNIEIELIKPIGDIKKVYLGMDQPESLIRAVYDKKQGLSINCIGQPA